MPQGDEMKRSAFNSVLLAAFLVAGCDQFSQPKNFDDCILKHMDGVTSDKAALLINRSCREKFPGGSEEEKRSRDLTYAELSKLTGRASLSFGNYYSGSLYNGNEGITVTSVTIRVTTKLGEVETTREYTDEVTIPPLSTKDFGVNIVVGDEGTDYSWGINGARGYRK